MISVRMVNHLCQGSEPCTSDGAPHGDKAWVGQKLYYMFDQRWLFHEVYNGFLCRKEVTQYTVV